MKLSYELLNYDSLLDVITSFNNYEELINFIKNVGSFGQKTGGLLVRLIYESEIGHFDGEISSIPLDRHDIEISYLTGIINTDKLTEKEINLLCKSYIEVSYQLQIKPDKVDKYLWEVGNKYCNKKDCKNCPLINECQTKIRRSYDIKC